MKFGLDKRDTGLYVTADKKLRFTLPKLPSCLRASTHRQAATSFIRKTLFAI